MNIECITPSWFADIVKPWYDSGLIDIVTFSDALVNLISRGVASCYKAGINV